VLESSSSKLGQQSDTGDLPVTLHAYLRLIIAILFSAQEDLTDPKPVVLTAFFLSRPLALTPLPVKSPASTHKHLGDPFLLDVAHNSLQ